MRRRQSAVVLVVLSLFLLGSRCEPEAKALARQVARRQGSSVDEVLAAAKSAAQRGDQSTDGILRSWADQPAGDTLLNRIMSNPQLRSVGERVRNVTKSSLCELAISAISDGELPSRREIADAVQSNAIGENIPGVSQVIIVDDIARFFIEIDEQGTTSIQYRLFLAKLQYC